MTQNTSFFKLLPSFWAKDQKKRAHLPQCVPGRNNEVFSPVRWWVRFLLDNMLARLGCWWYAMVSLLTGTGQLLQFFSKFKLSLLGGERIRYR